MDPNARIAAAYDAVVYDPLPSENLDLERLLGVAGVYGVEPQLRDVLDLGCGTGVPLERAAREITGRAVGVDISPVACVRARSRLESFGSRAEIICKDFLSLDEGHLGSFDLILCVGVIFITPANVLDHLMRLIGTALRPGGLAVISYYSGGEPLQRSHLYRLLAAATSGESDPVSAVAKARSVLAVLEGELARDSAGNALALSAVRYAEQLQNPVLYHEALVEPMSAIRTSALSAALRPYNVRFLSFLDKPGSAALRCDSHGRSMAADLEMFARGGYRYALFCKADEERCPDLRATTVEWHANFQQALTQEGAPVMSFLLQDGRTVSAQSPESIALLTALSAGPATWMEVWARMLSGLAKNHVAIDSSSEPRAIAELSVLWAHGMIGPRIRR